MVFSYRYSKLFNCANTVTGKIVIVFKGKTLWEKIYKIYNYSLLYNSTEFYSLETYKWCKPIKKCSYMSFALRCDSLSSLNITGFCGSGRFIPSRTVFSQSRRKWLPLVSQTIRRVFFFFSFFFFFAFFHKLLSPYPARTKEWYAHRKIECIK